MSCNYVREYYGVPAEVGRRVIAREKIGIIAADRGHYIGVNFDFDKPGVIRNVHPTDFVIYLGMGVVRKMTRSQARYAAYLEVADLYENFKHYLRALQTADKLTGDA